LETSKVFDIDISKLDLLESANLVNKWLSQDKKRQVVTANSEMLYLAYKDKEFKNILQNADMVTPDGVGSVWAAKTLDTAVKERVAGYDLLRKILEVSRAKVFLLGAKDEVVKSAARKIGKQYQEIDVVGYKDGYFVDDELVIKEINSLEPDIIFVALGCPRQEIWISKNLEKLNVKVAMGVGGSFDVIAGIVKRAPIIWQKLGVEWLYRLIKQPSRFTRMLALPKFVYIVLKMKVLN
jgi:N-acetylglucosaminyldiphosphoundecaprenol N-acetyl-beta-D-mannosaminyltransferase